jgi:small subunit ribosomal protein S17
MTEGNRPYGRRKVLEGTVVSDKMQKTVVVAVERLTRHPLYKKTIRRTKKYKAHDEENACRVGDRVRIVETRPLSKTKRWRVVEILLRGPQIAVRPEEVEPEVEAPAVAGPPAAEAAPLEEGGPVEEPPEEGAQEGSRP